MKWENSEISAIVCDFYYDYVLLLLMVSFDSRTATPQTPMPCGYIRMIQLKVRREMQLKI